MMLTNTRKCRFCFFNLADACNSVTLSGTRLLKFYYGNLYPPLQQWPIKSPIQALNVVLKDSSRTLDNNPSQIKFAKRHFNNVSKQEATQLKLYLLPDVPLSQ